jgi:hypothetical protein
VRCRETRTSTHHVFGDHGITNPKKKSGLRNKCERRRKSSFSFIFVSLFCFVFFSARSSANKKKKMEKRGFMCGGTQEGKKGKSA